MNGNAPRSPKRTDIKPDILYRDEHIIVAYKPYGVLSEAHDTKPNMPALLKSEPGGEIFTVHRLDRTTQGLIVYARTAEAAKKLSANLQSGEFRKTYLAVVSGEPDNESGELSDLLFFDRKKNKSYIATGKRVGVKEALLSYELIGRAELNGKAISLISIKLITGRTHQIRVQFASRKMPLLGDRRYGSDIKTDQIMLCSSELRFLHPISSKPLSFSYTPKNEAFALFDI